MSKTLPIEMAVLHSQVQLLIHVLQTVEERAQIIGSAGGQFSSETNYDEFVSSVCSALTLTGDVSSALVRSLVEYPR